MQLLAFPTIHHHWRSAGPSRLMGRGHLQGYVARGAWAFLRAEYKYMTCFMMLMLGAILLLIGPTAQGLDGALFSATAGLGTR